MDKLADMMGDGKADTSVHLGPVHGPEVSLSIWPPGWRFPEVILDVSDN
jgi:hypothetical protein